MKSSLKNSDDYRSSFFPHISGVSKPKQVMRARETLAKSDQVAGVFFSWYHCVHGTTGLELLGLGLIGNGLNLRIKHGDCWKSLNFQWSLEDGNDRTT